MRKISIKKALLFLTVFCLSLVLIVSGTNNSVKAAEISEPLFEEPNTREPSDREGHIGEPDAGKAGKPVGETPNGELNDEAPSTETPNTEAPNAEAPNTEEPNTEEPNTEAANAEESDTEAADAEEPGAQDPNTEETSAEEPDAEESMNEEPVSGEPNAEDAADWDSETDEPTDEEVPAEEELLAKAIEFPIENPQTDDAPEADTVMFATVSNVDVRLEPDGMSPIILTIREETEVQVLSVICDWMRIRVLGQVGWIYTGGALDLPEEDMAYTPKKVTIFTSRRMQMNPGETIYLTSVLEGFEDCEELRFRWECDKGNGFEPVPGGNSDHYAFPASVETISWSWRLNVSFR